MTIVFELSYCNVYGTGYQLRYVYRNIDPGIAVEYITDTSNLLSNLRSSQYYYPILFTCSDPTSMWEREGDGVY
jgi:hypothetical protein